MFVENDFQNNSWYTIRLSVLDIGNKLILNEKKKISAIIT